MPCHSMDSLETCVKIPLEPEILTDVVEKAKDFCLMHGKFSSYTSYQNTGCVNSICYTLNPSKMHF